MTHPTNQSLDTSKLSATGKALVAVREDIIRAFIERIKNKIHLADEIAPAIIVDTMPSFLDNLAQALSPHYVRKTAEHMATVGEEHGGERARLTNFSPDQLIIEYQILRQTIFEHLGQKIEISSEDKEIIYSSIDEALREAMLAYALVQNQIREQFIATLTHDLRNPLGAATMAIELIMLEPKSTDVPSLASKAFDNLHRVDRMIEDLLNATYIKAGGRLQLTISKFDLSGLVQEVVKDMRLNHGDRFKVELEPAEGYWSRDHLKRALENLIINALKYGQKRSPVTIKLTTEFGRAVLSVHNEGTPIPLTEQENIFKVFQRTHRPSSPQIQGWGLGLPLVRGIAEAHGGGVTLDSSESMGTTFLINLPKDARPFQGAVNSAGR